MKRFLLTCFLGFLFSIVWAQERSISGTVTSEEDGSELPGVNILLKGTSIGTVTDNNGNYTLSVPQEGGTLVFTFIGLESQEVDIGNRSVIDVAMRTDITQLTEVVVTALNIPREKASLGYATQQVDGEVLTRGKQQNFVNSLSGRVAGVQIRTNNNFAGSTNVLIRGNKSVSGNNQPLYVVDGVPLDNRTGNTIFQEGGRFGYDYGNTASDINPEDIESINILKGAAAAALYGSRAANGVIMITTKRGKARKGVGIAVSSGVTAGVINRDTFIAYQDQYGAGYGPYYDNLTGPEDHPYFRDTDVDGDGVNDLVVVTTEDASYGAAFDPTLNVYHWDSFVPESPNFGRAYPWLAAENTPLEFFETQMEFTNSIALSGGNENNTFRVGYTNYNMQGILPNSELQRHNINFNGSSQVNEKLRADLSLNYTLNNTLGRYSTGYGDNLMTNFRQWWQTNVDIKSLEDLYKRTGRNITWNARRYDNPELPIYWDNPYWTRYENYQTDERSRIFGNVTLNYQIVEWLNVMARASVDSYNELREERRAVGSVPTEFGVPKSDGTRNDESSGYLREDRRVGEYNYDLIFTANRELSDVISLTGILGTNIRRQRFDRVMSSTNGGLAVPGVYSLNNSALPPLLSPETSTVKEVYGFFANANFGFRNAVYLDLMGRNDISSALPVDNNSYFYHSEALSIVFTEFARIPFLNYGKVRINYAEVGNDTDANRTINTFTRFDNFGSAIIFSYPTYVNNPDLVPERTKSWETGLELIGIDKRLTMDLALYQTNSVDQIVEVEVSKASGMGFKYLNGGDIENRGIELALGYDIIRNQNFTWNASVNWAKNISEVNSLPSDIENFVINNYQGGVSTNATVGMPYGVFRGTGFQYLNGRRVVNEDGFYVSVSDQVIGDPNPDWTGGFSNAFTYKGVRLSFLVDVQRGGDVWSLDMHYGQGTGVTANTAGLNELGNPVRDPVDEGGGIILEGVQADGSENTVRAPADSYDGAFYWGDEERNPSQLTTYDASYVKLREVALSYTLPTNILNNIFQSASLSLVGRNLWIIDKNLPYADPESGLGAGNGQGYISGAYPTLKTVEFRLDLNF